MVSSRSLLSSLVYSASGLAQTSPRKYGIKQQLGCCRVFSVNEEQLRPFNPTN
ncbi:Hypothetical predicted protein [Prunus dulcis]|uniref:Uncharacterized protein n=1 Tax=Prunus dulcis TaxID=3755 RepID=A0A5E4ETA8_PRUDU|nr:Hypothetical predicted protein [Prunus dulcis]